MFDRYYRLSLIFPIKATGLKNLQNLKRLTAAQMLDYDFQYYISSFPTDYSIVVLSEGRSIVDVDVIVPVVPSSEQHQTDILAENLAKARCYLAACRYENAMSQDAFLRRSIE